VTSLTLKSSLSSTHEILHLSPLFLHKHERNFCFTASAFESLILFSLCWMSLISFIVSDNKFVVFCSFVTDCDRKLKFGSTYLQLIWVLKYVFQFCNRAVFRNRCAANLYKKLHIRTLWLEKGNILSFAIRIPNNAHTGSSSIVLFNMCYVLFSYAYTLILQGFICRYIFMAIYSFVPPFSWDEINFVVCDKLRCAAGEESLGIAVIEEASSQSSSFTIAQKISKFSA
jgi:hypothetical protein